MYIYNLNAVTSTGCGTCKEEGKREVLSLKKRFDEERGHSYDTTDYYGTWDYLTDLVGFVSEEMGIDETEAYDYIS